MGLERLSYEQETIAQSPPSGRLFLYGPAGAGKTSTGVARLNFWVTSGIPAEQILILVPQRTLARPYLDLIRDAHFSAGGMPDVVTLGGLAQRMIALFWPLLAGDAGFQQPNRPPTFLTLETAQYYLAQLVKPLLDQGYFETVHLDRNRIFSQIIDNLNKAASVGFDPSEIGERLTSAWIGKPEQVHAYQEAQECATLFREYCLRKNLLDYSLQMDVFRKQVWNSFLVREYVFSRYRYLIYENVEEDVPVVHDILAQWLPKFEAALLIYDTDGGYRSFLGADSESGWNLQVFCDKALALSRLMITSQSLESYRESLGRTIRKEAIPQRSVSFRQDVKIIRQSFYPQLLDSVTAQVKELIDDRHVPPGEIAILAPFLSDSLRFSLLDRLARAGIPARTHRPSRSLRDEIATQTLLTLAKLAHPQWNLVCSLYDVRSAFMHTIQGLDLVRADVLAHIVYRPNLIKQGLSTFEKIRPETQERITYQIGAKYERLRLWLEEYRAGDPLELDIFLSRIFGEILSQPGFGFHQNFDDAAVTARLIESVQKFRWAASAQLNDSSKDIGLEYVQMVTEGVIAAQYLQPTSEQEEEAVFIAPAYTFLMVNQPVSYQFWLDIGSLGWWERLYQPLTHPVVLSRHWQPAKLWTDADEYATNQLSLERLTSGLIRRCRQGIFLCSSGVNERGDEPRGPLLQAVQAVLQRSKAQEDGDAETV